MGRNHYKNFLKLLEKWPLDEAKAGRDLGEHIRSKIGANFHHGEITVIKDEKGCIRVYESLNRISCNVHFKKYPRLLNSTSIGISPEICGLAISDHYKDKINR